jgi:hypothetical protein
VTRQQGVIVHLRKNRGDLEEQNAVLEDITQLLRFSENEIITLLAILKKASSAIVAFRRDYAEITFESFKLPGQPTEISVEVEIEEKNCIRKTKYNISKAVLANEISSR